MCDILLVIMTYNIDVNKSLKEIPDKFMPIIVTFTIGLLGANFYDLIQLFVNKWHDSFS